MEDEQRASWLAHPVPFLKAFCQSNPITASLETFISASLEEEFKRKTKILFEELSAGSLAINKDSLRQSDLLWKIEIACRAIHRTKREEKVKIFAHLILGAEDEGAVQDIDEFEYYLTIVDELNYRELELLEVLDRYYQVLRGKDFATNKELENEVSKNWSTFLNEAADKLSISQFEVENMLQRLASKGCYEPFGGFGSQSGGILTHTFDRIREILRNGAKKQGPVCETE